MEETNRRENIVEEEESSNVSGTGEGKKEGQGFDNLRENEFEEFIDAIVWFLSER